MEGILLDTMFDLPSLEGIEEVVISKEVVEGAASCPSRGTTTPA
jgi:ATP-dependent Clp protease ATP-binding subunit ClpX